MQTTLDILLVWVAFLLVYFQDHIKAIYNTLQSNPLSWRRWWAVMKGTFTRKTAFPFLVLVLLTVAMIFINHWQTNESNESINQIIQKIDNLTDRIDKLITTLEAQNTDGKTK
jgi:hypothetical protein